MKKVSRFKRLHRHKHLIKYWVPVFIYAILIYSVTTIPLVPEEPEKKPEAKEEVTTEQPGPEQPQPSKPKPEQPTPIVQEFTKSMSRTVFYLNDTVPHFDVLANIGIYFWFGIMVFFALVRSSRFDVIQIIYITTVVGFLYSIVLELNQLHIPSRIADPYDTVFNSLGMLIGAVAAYGLKLRMERQKAEMPKLKL